MEKHLKWTYYGGGFEDGTFSENDGLAGVWYSITDSSLNKDEIVINAFNKLNSIVRF